MEQLIKRIPLWDAVQKTVEALSISDQAACERIRQACRNLEIHSWGAAPLNSHKNIKIARELAAGRSWTEALGRDQWNLECDFSANTLGRYQYVELDKDAFAAWLKNARTKPESDRAPGRPPGAAVDDSSALAEIKKLIDNGASPTKACRVVAEKLPGHSKESTYERLRKKQRAGKIK